MDSAAGFFFDSNNKYKTDMKTWIAFLTAALVSCAASGAKPYPRDTCLVTGNKLGSMGPPVTKVYDGQEVKFCCQPCVAQFEKNPSKYMADLSN